MSAPDFRVEFNYTVLAFPHKIRLYVDAIPSLDVLGYDFAVQSPFLQVPGSDAIDALWDKIKGFYDTTDASFGVANLQQLQSGSWVPIGGYSTAVAPTGTGAVVSAQETVVFKDVSNKKLVFVMLENKNPGPDHTNSYPSLGGLIKALVDSVISPVANTDLGAWVLSSHNLPVKRWIGDTVSYNRALRRKRGLV